MNIEDKARKSATEARQQAEHLEETILHRAAEAIEEQTDEALLAETRELAARQRQQAKEAKERLLSRSEEEIGRE
ncbi:MAG: hypothetical protein AAF921_16060 [Cyanobacteria bacterium P01_D01_bin.44]